MFACLRALKANAFDLVVVVRSDSFHTILRVFEIRVIRVEATSIVAKLAKSFGYAPSVNAVKDFRSENSVVSGQPPEVSRLRLPQNTPVFTEAKCFTALPFGAMCRG